jgi:hypothetical protein
MESVSLDVSKGIALTITNQVKVPRMSKMQLHVLRQLIKDGENGNALKYINTFLQANADDGYGLRRQAGSATNIRRHLTSHKSDKLADKPIGSILKLLERQFSPNHAKTPGNTALGDWIGVEIECVVPRRSFDGYQDQDNDYCRQALHAMIVERRIRNIQAKQDGSIRANDDSIGVEFTCLFQRSNPDNLRQLCELLSELGAYVNASCGLHVHLDCRDAIDGRNYRRAMVRAQRIAKALPVLAAMQPDSRLSNTYCKVGISRIRGDRYFAVNCTSLTKFQTIEMRLHSGTINYDKISNWIELLYLISREKALKKRCLNYSELSEQLPKASRQLMSYVRARILGFGRHEMMPVQVGA